MGCTVSVDVTVHDASHARSTLRLGWAYPGDRSSVSWIDAPTALDAAPVITITRRDVGSVLVCEVLPVGSAGQEGQITLAESQPVHADTPASPVLSAQPPASAPAATVRTSDDASSMRADSRPVAALQQNAPPALQSRGLQSREILAPPHTHVPQRTQPSDDRPSMIQSVSVHGDGVVGCLMRSHVSFPIHEMTTANSM